MVLKVLHKSLQSVFQPQTDPGGNLYYSRNNQSKELLRGTLLYLDECAVKLPLQFGVFFPELMDLVKVFVQV